VIISDTVINVLLTYFDSEYLVNGGTQRIRVCCIVLSGRSITAIARKPVKLVFLAGFRQRKRRVHSD